MKVFRNVLTYRLQLKLKKNMVYDVLNMEGGR